MGAQPARARHRRAERGAASRAFRATELADVDKAPVLRDYLKRRKFEVGQFFDGVGANASDDELLRIALCRRVPTGPLRLPRNDLLAGVAIIMYAPRGT